MGNRGIFCLEGEWDNDLRKRRSVRPLLTLLEDLEIAKCLHRDVATRTELEYYLGKWSQARYKNFPVLYLATHGDTGGVWLGHDWLELDDLAGLLAGKCRDRIVYFGSCSTMSASEGDLHRFAKVTHAKAVIGYVREVDWLGAAAFEVLLLERLVRGNRSDALFNHLVRDHGAFAESLGLVVATRTKVRRAGS